MGSSMGRAMSGGLPPRRRAVRRLPASRFTWGRRADCPLRVCTWHSLDPARLTVLPSLRSLIPMSGIAIPQPIPQGPIPGPRIALGG